MTVVAAISGGTVGLGARFRMKSEREEMKENKAK